MIQTIQLNQKHYLKKGQYKNEEPFLIETPAQKFFNFIFFIF